MHKKAGNEEPNKVLQIPTSRASSNYVPTRPVSASNTQEAILCHSPQSTSTVTASSLQESQWLPPKVQEAMGARTAPRGQDEPEAGRQAGCAMAMFWFPLCIGL